MVRRLAGRHADACGDRTIDVTAIGWKAHAALTYAQGVARVFTVFSESVYLTANDEIVWLGTRGALHARAIFTNAPLPVDGAMGRFSIDSVSPWRPPAPTFAPCSVENIVAGCHALGEALGVIGTPDGLGALIAGAKPTFPLDRASHDALRLARACADDDPATAAAAAYTLLGVGPGLTPSGDDYVGGAFFGRDVLVRARGEDAARWRRAAATVLAAAPQRTHPISVALLSDLVEGQAWAPLHELTAALAAGDRRDVVLAAAQRLTRIGHSSGWDILAGFVGAIVGLPERSRGPG